MELHEWIEKEEIKTYKSQLEVNISRIVPIRCQWKSLINKTVSGEYEHRSDIGYDEEIWISSPESCSMKEPEIKIWES